MSKAKLGTSSKLKITENKLNKKNGYNPRAMGSNISQLEFGVKKLASLSRMGKKK